MPHPTPRTDVIQTGVRSASIVEGFDVVEERGASSGPAGEATMMDQLVFEADREGFDKNGIMGLTRRADGGNEAV
jgi:hypothetical protein